MEKPKQSEFWAQRLSYRRMVMACARLRHLRDKHLCLLRQLARRKRPTTPSPKDDALIESRKLKESTKEERSSCSSLKLRRFALLLDRHTKDAASALSLYYDRFLHNAKEARASPGNLRSQRNAFEQHFPLLPLRRFKSSLSTRTLHPSFGLNRSARVLCCGIRCHFPQGLVPRGPHRLKIGFRGVGSLPGR